MSIKTISSLFLLSLLFVSCSRVLNPSRMFQLPKDFKYSDFSGKENADYKIAANDIIELKMFTNEGLKLVDLTPATGGMTSNVSTGLQFTVDREGNIRMPTIGMVHLQGLTIKEAQQQMEKLFAEYYIKPFCMIKVMNRKALVFPGSGSTGTVVSLSSDNTTLIELLTMAGGVPPTGKAYKVKVMRGNISNPQVQIVDFSTLEGMKKADINIQANDIVYIEPVRNLSQSILNQIAPVLALLTTTLLVIQLVRK